jgi:hypothetical protein
MATPCGGKAGLQAFLTWRWRLGAAVAGSGAITAAMWA